jgi:hypothetical protein
MTDKPDPGDTIALDTNDDGSAGKVFHRPADGRWRVMDNVDVDTTEPDSFIVRGKKPNIYAEHPWEVKVTDDEESTPNMRRGTVTVVRGREPGWAY